MAAGLIASGITMLRQRLKPNFVHMTRIYTARRNFGKSRKNLWRGLAIASGTLGAVNGCIYALDRSAVEALVNELRPPVFPWDFKGLITTLDHASVRRGWQVYKTVCSQCHGIEYVAFRELVGVTHTEEEAKAIAETAEVVDGPDDKGNMFTRPGRLSDRIPSPFPNEEAARAANNGAFPADLTYIINARRDGENYVFSLLTGWMDPPAGIALEDGQSFNVYFAGGAIGMGQIIEDGSIEFEDGTPASQSQIAKDVVSFLTWTSNPEFDRRKSWLIKSTAIFIVILTTAYQLTKQKFVILKTRNVFYVPSRKKGLD